MNARRLNLVQASVMVAVLLLFAAAAAAVWSGRFDRPAHAAQPEPPRSTMLENYSISTRACLTDGSRALLEIGERDTEVIVAWAVRQCGYKLAFYFTNYLARPRDEAERYAHALIRREVNSIVAFGGKP